MHCLRQESIPFPDPEDIVENPENQAGTEEYLVTGAGRDAL